MIRQVVPVCVTVLALAPLGAVAEELGVNDAVASALAAQPRLRAAESEVRAATARASQAGWNHLGTVETAFLYTPEQKPLRVDFPGIPQVVPPISFEVQQLRTHSLTTTFTQPVWTWGAIAKNHASARKEESASSHQLARTRQQVVLDASQAFFLAATASAAVSVAERNLAQQQAFLQVAQSRARAGTAANLDVLKAELAVAEAESDLLEARNRERNAREALTTVSMDARFRSAELKQLDETEGELPSEEDAVARALGQRPDLKALRQQGEALGLRVGAIRASSLPGVAFRASLTQQSDDAAKVFAGDSRLYQLGFALSWDPTGVLRNRAKAAEVRALQEELAQAIRGTEEGVGLEVRTALSSAQEARERVRVRLRAMSVAEEQVRVARLAYREGVITSIEAQDAELALTAARFAVLRARLDAALAQARLRCALGE